MIELTLIALFDSKDYWRVMHQNVEWRVGICILNKIKDPYVYLLFESECIEIPISSIREVTVSSTDNVTIIVESITGEVQFKVYKSYPPSPKF